MKKLLAGRKGRMAVLALTSLCGGAVEAGLLLVFTRMALAITRGKNEAALLGDLPLSAGDAVWFALTLVALRLGFAVLTVWQSARLTTGVVADMRKSLARAFLEASWTAQQSERTGRLQELLTTFTGKGADLIGSLTHGVTMGFTLLALLGSAIVVDPISASIMIAAVFVLGAVLWPLRAAVRRHSRSTAASGMDFATCLSELSQLGREMHIFNVQPATVRRVAQLIDTNAVAQRRLTFLRELNPVVYTALAYLALIGALGLVAGVGSERFASVGAVMLLVMRSLYYGQALQMAFASIASALPFLQILQEQLIRYQAARVPEAEQPVGRVGALALRRVCFDYTPGRRVLKDIDIEIAPTEVVGIVGPSGSGKSTLVQLLLGLRRPTSGRVVADERDIHEFSRPEWARKVTFVPQSAHLISGSIADNVRFFRDGVSQEAIERALRLAHLHEDVMSWPDGCEHQVGERGTSLSGGQQQRLCIARALVEDPEVLILDEPTSALDIRSEHLIRQTLLELKKRMTVIIIAHRLSTLDICDRIMVIQDGSLTAFDEPETLAKTNEFYREALRLSALR